MWRTDSQTDLPGREYNMIPDLSENIITIAFSQYMHMVMKNAPQCSVNTVGRLNNFFYGLPPICVKTRFDVANHARVDYCILSTTCIGPFDFPSITKSLMPL
jgi:hypothetical protein